MLRRGIRVLFFLLGWFELMMVVRLLTVDTATLREEQLYYPSEYFKYPDRYLLVAFTFLLGLIRLVWSVSDNTFPAWLFITAAHVGECTFLWTCAQLPHFNPFRLSLLQLIERVLVVKAGNPQSRTVLFIVPILILLLLIHGPGDSRVSTKAKKN